MKKVLFTILFCIITTWGQDPQPINSFFLTEEESKDIPTMEKLIYDFNDDLKALDEIIKDLSLLVRQHLNDHLKTQDITTGSMDKAQRIIKVRDELELIKQNIKIVLIHHSYFKAAKHHDSHEMAKQSFWEYKISKGGPRIRISNYLEKIDTMVLPYTEGGDKIILKDIRARLVSLQNRMPKSIL